MKLINKAPWILIFALFSPIALAQSLEQRVSKLEQDVKLLQEAQNKAPPSTTTSDRAPPSTTASDKAPPSTTASNYSVKVSGIDDKLELKISTVTGQKEVKIYEGNNEATINLSQYLIPGETLIRLTARLYNNLGPNGANVEIFKNNQPHQTLKLGGKNWNIGWIDSGFVDLDLK